jgi:hypothetical protein
MCVSLGIAFGMAARADCSGGAQQVNATREAQIAAWEVME